MKNIKEDINSKNYKPYYLFYGNEPYLKTLYKNTLKNAIVDANDEMNFARFDSKEIDLKNVLDIAITLPFFNEKRLIVIENSLLFKNANDFSTKLELVPPSTIIIFVEDEIDKRGKLYKKVSKEGYAISLDTLDNNNLKIFIAKILKENNKKITEKNALYLIDKIGSDMETINSELNKLIAFAYDKEIITKEDIDEIVTTNINNRIFDMIEAIANKNKKKAVELYYDLILLKEKPIMILFLINRQFNILLQIKDLHKQGFSNGEISKEVGIPPFAVSKNIKMSNNFSYKELKHNLEYGVETDEKIKRGLIEENIAIDILIVKLSS